jgi:hypothetical protein
MEIWEVEEDQIIALIYEINRLGQSLLEFDEKEYSNYFSSRLAAITPAVTEYQVTGLTASMRAPIPICLIPRCFSTKT